MSLFKNIVLLSATISVAATLAFAGAHSASPQDRAVKARQSKMTLYAYNLGILGAMAKGEVEYDAGAAGGAASNLAMLTSIWMPDAWAAGTDNESVKNTAALPKMWEDSPEEVGAKAQALSDAVQVMAKVAGTDLDGLRGAIGSVGQACGACHKVYRAKQ
jgi:cytochrome c556